MGREGNCPTDHLSLENVLLLQQGLLQTSTDSRVIDQEDTPSLGSLLNRSVYHEPVRKREQAITLAPTDFLVANLKRVSSPVPVLDLYFNEGLPVKLPRKKGSAGISCKENVALYSDIETCFVFPSWAGGTCNTFFTLFS